MNRVWMKTLGALALALALTVGCSDDSSGGSESGSDTSDTGSEQGDTGTGEGDVGEGDTGQGDTGQGDTGQGDTGQGDTGEGDTGEGDAGEGDAGEGDAGEGDAGEGDAGEGDAGEVGDLSCATYCSALATACTGDNEQYASEQDCLDFCNDIGPWDLGTLEDTGGNTLGCRIYHAGVAATMAPEDHCFHAGPQGGGVCGTLCENYCDLMDVACTGTNEQYADAAACEDYCTTFGALPLGEQGDAAGNSVSCRYYHASVAATTAPIQHCVHAGPSGGNACGTWCDNYCWLAGNNCSGANELYADDLACQAACGDFSPDGLSGDAAGDSVQCRIYHLGVAGEVDPGQHCLHGASDGGGVCVDAVAFTYAGDAMAAYQQSCKPCHVGATATGCSGGTCFASFYEATQLPSSFCAGSNVAECGLTRMSSGSMPPGPGMAPPDVIETIQNWIDDGQLP